MLGLPSTSYVGRVLPKRAFYENLKVSAQLKDDFVRKVERFEIAHSIKPSTTNIPEGEKVLEVLVLRVDLREREVPKAALKFIAENNQHKLVFACAYEGEVCLAVLLKKLVVGEWMPEGDASLDLRSESMDAFWDSLASQVAYGDRGLELDSSSQALAMSVEERFARDQRMAALRVEIARLDARCRREKQFNKKNQLFAQAKELRAKLAELEREGRA